MPWTWRTRARVSPPRPAPTIVTGVVMVFLSRAGWSTVPRAHLGTVLQLCQDGAHGDQDAADRTARGRALEGADRRGRDRDPRRRWRERADDSRAHGTPCHRGRSDLLARRQQERT